MSYGSHFQKQCYFALPQFLKNAIASAYGVGQKKLRNGGIYREFYEFLDKSQWLSNRELEAYQYQKTKEFLTHAGQHSPYYNELFSRCRFNPSSIRTLEDLRSLPIMSKSALRDNLVRIQSTDKKLGKLHWVNTSGTTGLQLRFPETVECFQQEYAFRFHNYASAGVKLGEPWAFCAGHPVASPARATPPFWIHDFVNNWLLMSSYHLQEANLLSYVRKLEEFKPVMVGGYPSSVYVLALANEHYGGNIRPKAVFTASETLFDFQREAIERSFRCPAYTYYGTTERSAFIGECDKRSLHLKLERSYVEVLDDDGNPVAAGQPGRLICTVFGNSATPFIRYDVGDTVVVSGNQTCACGRNGLILEKIVGRVEDYVLTPDGRFVGRLDHLFKDATHVKLAQIVQDDIDSIRLRIVKDLGYDHDDERRILKEARLRLGAEIKVELEYVSEISRTRTGKFPFVVSNIKGKQLFGKRVLAGDSEIPSAETAASR